jgi:site-specific recombinase XerD
MKTTIKKLKQAVDDYLLWMISARYADATIKNYEQILNHFVDFIACHKIGWDQIFSSANLHGFDQSTKTQLAAVRGLCRYLVKQKRIVAPIEKEKYLLPNVYGQYLNYYATTRQAGNSRIKSIRRVLAAFDGYLENTKIKLAVLTIEQIDAFFAEFSCGFSPATCKVYRSIVRGFLSYLFHQCHTLKRDLAPLVVGAPIFARAKPPTFLRADELKRLFDNIDLSSQSGLRTYAMLQLAYTLGLRPIEICQITLDNISFLLIFFLVGSLTALITIFIYGIFHETTNKDPWIIIGSLIQFQANKIILYISCFGLGVYAFSNEWLKNGKTPGNYIFWTILSIGLMYFQGKTIISLINNFSIGLAIGYVLMRTFSVFTILLALISYGIKHWNRPSKFSRQLAANSYNIYLLHMLFVIVVQLLLLKWFGIPIFIKFAIVTLSTILLNYLISQYAIRPFPKLSVAGMITLFVLLATVLNPTAI